jgi:predicted DNA binding CopG/RHH family protein
MDAPETKSRTTLRVTLPEEILQQLKQRAESAGVSLTTYAAYVLTGDILER